MLVPDGRHYASVLPIMSSKTDSHLLFQWNGCTSRWRLGSASQEWPRWPVACRSSCFRWVWRWNAGVWTVVSGTKQNKENTKLELIILAWMTPPLKNVYKMTQGRKALFLKWLDIDFLFQKQALILEQLCFMLVATWAKRQTHTRPVDSFKH